MKKTFWIVVSVILIVILLAAIGVIIWLAIARSQDSKCFGSYGVEPNRDGAAITLCGGGRNSPCSFSKSTLQECITECENLSSFCEMFTYDASTLLMKIVSPNALFSSQGVNAYQRQS